MVVAANTRTIKVNPFIRCEWMTEEEKATKQVCALVRFEQCSAGFNSDQYGHVYVTFLTEKDGKPYGFSESEFELYDFELSCQMSPRPLGSGENTAYAFEAAMRPWRVTLDKAQKMVETLRKIDRKVEKLNQEWGRPDTYGQFVLRYLKAIGVRKVFLAAANQPTHGYETDYVKYAHDQLADACAAIDSRIYQKLQNWGENRWPITRY